MTDSVNVSFMSRTVLIIDDDARNIFALRLVLKTKGYHCLAAGDAVTGLDMLRQHPDIRVVLLDMMMPDMDGYQTIEAIRASPDLNQVPVIAVTAQAMRGDREKCLQAGASDYISKPVDVDELLAIMDKLI